MTWRDSVTPLRSRNFGWYFASRFSDTLGTMMAGIALTFAVLDITGSYRGALLILLVLFVTGGLLLASTDTDAAIAAARDTEDTGDPAVVVVPS